jgi:aspartate carbamoyltransferase catalytic subunit
MEFKGSHILSVSQFTIEDIYTIFKTAEIMEPYASRKKKTKVLEGAVLGNLFFEASTRSRISFGASFNRLGGFVNDTVGFKFSSMAKGESIHDTSRVISGYVDLMVVRHPEKGSVTEFSEASSVPVINGGDGPGEHPTQALLDLYTIYKERDSQLNNLNNLRICLVGDLKYGRTIHSLVKILSLFKNITYIFVAPEQLQIPEEIAEFLKSKNHLVSKIDNLKEAVSNMDIVYVTRIQEERFEDRQEFLNLQGYFRFNKEVYDNYCRENTIIMHPLPRDSRPESNELDVDLNDIHNLAIFRQTDNGIPIRMAIFALVLDVVNKVSQYGTDVQWYTPKR